MRLRQAITGLAASGAVMTGACAASRMTVHVDALAAQGAQGATRYKIIPGDPEVREDDLLFRELRTYLDRALEARGFASAPGDPEIVIVTTYGVGDVQQHFYTYTSPEQPYGPYRGAYGGVYGPQYRSAYSTGIGSYVTYARWLMLVAHDVRGGMAVEEARELWRVTSYSRGRSEDLRRALPILVAGAQPYLGRSTDAGAVTVALREDDEEVVAIREGVEVVE